LVAHDTPAVVQHTGGHALISFSDLFKPEKEQACPHSFFNHKYALTGRARNIRVAETPFIEEMGIWKTQKDSNP
jgi:hypothetical protein